MSKIKHHYTIADVLHLAADKYLVAHKRYKEGIHKEKYSCCAIDEAIYKLTGDLYSEEEEGLRLRIRAGLRNMGCDVDGIRLFEEYGDDTADRYEAINHNVQGMRYMWLKWAALMAEEQGV